MGRQAGEQLLTALESGYQQTLTTDTLSEMGVVTGIAEMGKNLSVGVFELIESSSGPLLSSSC